MIKSNKLQKAASRIALAMAFDREKFKDRLEEHIGGALSEYYKARLGRLNNKNKWIQHWETEVKSLMRSAAATVRHSIKGFKDKRKAYTEVKSYIKKYDLSYRRSAENEIVRDYDMKKITKYLSDIDTDNFWKMVDNIIEKEIESFVD